MNELYKKLGLLLKLERERKNLDLEKISQELKISEQHLEAIEAGEPEDLPAQLYYNLFAKSYAELLGIDFNRTIEAIRVDIGEPLEEEESAEEEEAEPAEKSAKKAKAPKKGKPEEEKEPSPYRWLFTILYAVAGVFIIFVAVYLIWFHESPSESSMEVLPGAADHSPSAVDTTEAANAEYARYNWATPAYQAPGPIKLRLTAREESWATVIADGDTVIFRTLVPYRQYGADAKYRMVISIAHPVVVDVTLNGQKVDLRDPETRRISRVGIDQANVNEFIKSYDPSAMTPQEPAPPPVKPRTTQSTQTTESTPTPQPVVTPPVQQDTVVADTTR